MIITITAVMTIAAYKRKAAVDITVNYSIMRHLSKKYKTMIILCMFFV
jgi:hypothetical protein